MSAIGKRSRRKSDQPAQQTQTKSGTNETPKSGFLGEHYSFASTDAPLTWRDIPTFAAVIGAISIALAVSRESGFFSVFDMKLLTLFSIEDTLRNSLSIVPLTLFAWGLGILLVRADVRLFRRPLRFKRPAAVILFVLVTAIGYVLFTPDWPASLFFLSVIIYVAVISWLREREKLSAGGVEVVYLFWVLITVFLLGAYEGQWALRSNERAYEMIIQTEVVSNVSLLRSTSDFFLVMQNPTEIWVVSRSDVKVLKLKQLEGPRALVPLTGAWAWIMNTWTQLWKATDPAPPPP